MPPPCLLGRRFISAESNWTANAVSKPLKAARHKENDAIEIFQGHCAQSLRR
jgi:hypothetical protein